MNVLMLSGDRKILDPHSSVHARMLEYGALFDELHIVVLSAKKHGFNTKVVSGNVTCYPTNVRFRPAYINRAHSLGRDIIKQNPDAKWIVTTQDPFELGLVGVKLKETFDTTLQVQLHGDFFNPLFLKESKLNRIRVQLMKRVLQKADCVRVVSKRIQDGMHKVLPRARTSTIIPIYTDVEKIRTATPVFDVHEKFSQFDTIAVMASRLESVKNIDLAINAFKTVVSRYPKAGLVVIGDGSKRKRLEEEALNQGISQNVVFTGWDDDVTSYLKTADLFINTSKHEGYCLSLVEAAAAGCPVVTTEVGVVGELFTKQNAFICPVGDIKCLTEKLLLAFEKPQTRNILAAKATEDLSQITRTKEEYLVTYKDSFLSCGEKT